MTHDRLKTKLYKAFGKRQQSIKIWNHDDNHLHTNEICTIMYNELSNVTNPADGYIPNFCSRLSRAGETMNL